jgi:hypothetical protein
MLQSRKFFYRSAIETGKPRAGHNPAGGIRQSRSHKQNVRYWHKADIEHTAWRVAIANALSDGVKGAVDSVDLLMSAHRDKKPKRLGRD